MIQLLTAQRSLAGASARALVFWARLVAGLGNLDADRLGDLDRSLSAGGAAR